MNKTDCKENQTRMAYAAMRTTPRIWEAMRDMMLCECNPMTRDDLCELIQRKPGVYGAFSGIAENGNNWNDNGTLKTKGYHNEH